MALLGNPNTGKTTVFNRLCGLRARTANFPGITVESRIGKLKTGPEWTGPAVEAIDLPGIYRLTLDLPEARLCREIFEGSDATGPPPEATCVIVDATNLSRNLRLVVEALRYGRPTVVALNMTDIAQRRGLTIDTAKLGHYLGCPVVSICGRTGEGMDELKSTMLRLVKHAAQGEDSGNLVHPTDSPLQPELPDSFDFAAVTAWSQMVVADSVGGSKAIGNEGDTFTERLDKTFTHPILGVLVFALTMGGLFSIIFWLAAFPMEWIDGLFGVLGTIVSNAIPPGAIRGLLVDGVIGGVAGTVVFVPQICLLFFLISLLEDTGYLARAAFVMDRVMCRFGLPGQAFVPLLSSHACAIPGIMSTRLIPDRHDRLTTILIAPFMSCTARIPVYVLLTTLLFGNRPMLAALAFFGCYGLGAAAAMFTAFITRRTILRGQSRPMVLELPHYKWPSVRNALLTTWDRGIVFLKNAGTIIMGICVVMWWLSAYPVTEPPAEALALREQAIVLRDSAALVVAEDSGEAASLEEAENLEARADYLEAKHAQANSFAGRIGKIAEPVFRPLGYDWQLTIGVMTSFAAREVFVSTMAVLLVGDAEADFEGEGIISEVKSATRDDGTVVFTAATSASLLVFYVLAMQCLPTLAVTRRETGSWKWPMLQFGYMTGLAYVFAFVTFRSLTWMGVT